MHISGVISALSEELAKNGNCPVCPKGEGQAAAHAVYHEDGRIIVSDSVMAGLADLLDIFGDIPLEDEAAASRADGGSAATSDVIGELQALLREHGDMVVYPNGSGSRPAEAVYVDGRKAVIADGARRGPTAAA
jgi:hypothetical protein